MSKLAVVVLHYQGREDTLECLQTIYQAKNASKSLIIVVLNSINSESDFSKIIIKKYPHCQLVSKKTNLGFAAGINLGLREAVKKAYEKIIILNNDTLIHKDLLVKLDKYSQDPSIGLISPKIYFACGWEYHRERYQPEQRGKVIWYAGGMIDWSNIYAYHRGVDEVDYGQFDRVEKTDYASGCCLLVKKSVIEKIGLLDEKYFLYFEDVDYSIRAKKAGFKVMFCPQAIIWHKNASSSGKPGSPVHVYYLTRNRLYFALKYASLRAKIALARESFNYIIKGKIERRAVIDFLAGRMGKGSI